MGTSVKAGRGHTARMARRRQLPPGIIGHDAQVHVAVRPGLAARMGAKQINRAHIARAANGIQTLRQRLAAARKAGR